jgi:hypothetical protein
MQLPVGRKKQKHDRKAAGGGGLAGLLALGAAGWMLLRKRRRAGRPEVFQTEPEVVTGQGHGITAAMTDDATLAQRVQSAIFRGADAPKGDVDVNAEFGVIFLRGLVPSDDEIVALVSAARDVDGVKDVRNLLHTPDSPAPAA